MFAKNTVFVIGAGASYDLGFPLGAGLRRSIHSMMDFNYDEFFDELKGAESPGDNALFTQFYNPRADKSESLAFKEAAEQIRTGILNFASVDDFLQMNNDRPRVAELCKAAIIKAIRVAESNSPLKNDPGLSSGAYENIWMRRLINMMLANSASRDSLFDDVAFIIFNYDRCLEHFLYSAVASVVLDPLMFATNMKRLRCFHPYGQVGQLPWQVDSKTTTAVAFGEHERRVDRQLASSIKTYSESVADTTELSTAQQWVEKADKLIFLGFGFHRQNLELLGQKRNWTMKYTYATAYGDLDLAVTRRNCKDNHQGFFPLIARF
jgi:hypothetical protein